MVAKSYQSLPLEGEPFIENGKAYILVRQSSKTTKKVRWYTEKEYAKLYPTVSVASSSSQKKVLGFEKGYITIFPKVSMEDPFFNQNKEFRYCRYWGWYCVSTEEYPEIPSNVIAKRLPWEIVGSNETLLPQSEIQKNLKENHYV